MLALVPAGLGGCAAAHLEAGLNDCLIVVERAVVLLFQRTLFKDVIRRIPSWLLCVALPCVVLTQGFFFCRCCSDPCA